MRPRTIWATQDINQAGDAEQKYAYRCNEGSDACNSFLCHIFPFTVDEALGAIGAGFSTEQATLLQKSLCGTLTKSPRSNTGLLVTLPSACS